MDKARRVELGKLKIKKKIKRLTVHKCKWVKKLSPDQIHTIPPKCNCDWCKSLTKKRLIETIIDKEAKKDIGLL